ncbi:efflux RND transporter permease subunit [Pleionea litopenaei]|uniref:MMPL family transporter n=1 Tax=Pleionea litopenaei TaxID=3070815 RepID=A0AA51X779_9GAMM|nr:MMPL family transporter [Pleionea sp. HL-JVS1]WMS87923.1 MMPL family transporter [Pleionea sp. HL-JVS1]
MKDRFINFSLQKAKQVYLLMVIVTFGLAAFIPMIQIDTDPENMLPETQADRVFHNQIKKEFSLYDAIVVGVVDEEGIYNPSTLANIHELTKHILAIEGVVQPDLMSLSTVDNILQGEGGTLRFEWMMSQPPENQAQAKNLANHVKRLPLLLDTLVSADDKAATIYVPIIDKNESYRISQDIQSYAEQLKGNADFHITGLPVAEDTFGFEMFVQMGISAPMAALMIFILMLVFFKNLKLVIAPMIVAMSTVISTMGLLIACGFTVHIMSSMIAIFLMPIAVVDSVHIMSEFADRFKPGRNAKDVAKEVVSHLFTPMLYTSVTSTVGFLSLALTPIPPVQVFGLFVGFGIMLAFFWTIIFMPAYISRMTPEQLKTLQDKMHGEGSGDSRVLGWFNRITLARSKTLILLFSAVFVVSLIGISKIQINDNPVRWFKEDHPIRVADEVLNHHFAGTYDAFLVLTNSDREEVLANYRKEYSQVIDDLNNSELASELQLLEDINIGVQISKIDDLMFSAESANLETLERLLAISDKYQKRLNYFTQPSNLEYLANLQQALLETGLVGKTNGMTDLIKTVNRELFSGESKDYRLPETQAGVAQALLQFQSSHRPQDLWRMVNPTFSRTNIWIQLTSGDNQDMSKVIKAVENYVSKNPLPEGMSLNWAGKTYINVVWQDAMVKGMLESLSSAFVVVLIMMIVLFRSFVFGLLAMLPLTLTITFIYGLIGWIGKDYDMPIAVLSALTLGLSVDFAIHFLERTRSLFEETKDFRKTMSLMFDEPGRAISRNAIVIAVGFTPLLFAPLVPYITVGVFLASIMAASALVTLLMLPAVMNVFKRWIFKS